MISGILAIVQIDWSISAFLALSENMQTKYMFFLFVLLFIIYQLWSILIIIDFTYILMSSAFTTCYFARKMDVSHKGLISNNIILVAR